MKKYFFKSDGTIKVVNMIILLSAIFISIMLFIFFKFLRVKYEEPNETYKKEEKTSSINLCNNCDFYFTLDSLSFETYHDYKISNYIDTTNMLINNLKFDEYDKDLISIETKDKDLVISVKNKVGKTKLVATYADIKREIDITITPDEIHSIKLLDHPYYIYNNKDNPLNLITDPIGIDTSNLNITVENPLIATIENGKIRGLSEGVTKIKLLYNGEETTEDLYVYNDLIHITKNKEVDELYNIKLSEFKDSKYNVIITLDDSANKGYTMSDLIITHEDNGITPIVEYDGKNSIDTKSYKYRITISGESGESIIKFTLGNTTRILRVGD